MSGIIKDNQLTYSKGKWKHIDFNSNNDNNNMNNVRNINMMNNMNIINNVGNHNTFNMQGIPSINTVSNSSSSSRSNLNSNTISNNSINNKSINNNQGLNIQNMNNIRNINNIQNIQNMNNIKNIRNIQNMNNIKNINNIRNIQNKGINIDKETNDKKEPETINTFIDYDLKNISSIANKFNGEIYGGVIRSFMLRKEDTKDINIWFNKQVDKNNFVRILLKEYNGKIVDGKIVIKSPQTNFKYIIDCVVMEKFMINDFNVNCFTYNGKEINYKPSFICGTIFNKNEAMNDVKNKRMRFSKYYIQNRDEERLKRFKNMGWDLYFH